MTIFCGCIALTRFLKESSVYWKKQTIAFLSQECSTMWSKMQFGMQLALLCGNFKEVGIWPCCTGIFVSTFATGMWRMSRFNWAMARSNRQRRTILHKWHGIWTIYRGRDSCIHHLTKGHQQHRNELLSIACRDPDILSVWTTCVVDIDDTEKTELMLKGGVL